MKLKDREEQPPGELMEEAEVVAPGEPFSLKLPAYELRVDSERQEEAAAQVRAFLAEMQPLTREIVAFLEDKVETLVKVARDMRLLPVSLHFAEWGYSTPQQQAIAASLPRVRSHAYSDALGPLMLGTGKEAV